MNGVKVVAINKDGYQRVIATFDTQQVRMTDHRIDLNDISIIEVGGGGIGVVISPESFPEAVKFVVTELGGLVADYEAAARAEEATLYYSLVANVRSFLHEAKVP